MEFHIYWLLVHFQEMSNQEIVFGTSARMNIWCWKYEEMR